MTVNVDVQYCVDENDLPTEGDFSAWAATTERLVEQSQSTLEMLVRIVDATESAELNQRWRHRSGPTNVLSFPTGETPANEFRLLGDVVICASLVRDEAERYGKTLQARWAHMFVHGMLHLLGYDHEQKDEALIMESMESRALAQLGYDDPYELQI